MEKQTPTIVPSENTQSQRNIAIVYSSWHPEYIARIREILKGYLSDMNIAEVQAPGSNEVPWVASKLASQYDGFICVGILIKGDTLHFENVSSACSIGIMQAQIQTGKPMLNVILSCYDFDQVEERISGDKCTLPYIADTLRNVLQYV